MAKVLVLGHGGREHALLWSLVQDSEVEVGYAAKGNPGIEADEKKKQQN